MNYDPVELAKMAGAKEDENFRFRRFLKDHSRLSSEEVDGMVFNIAARVWKRTDCTACANCCRVVAPTFNQADVDRLANHLGISNAEFVARYLQEAESAEEAPWTLRDRPCPFLANNRCTVYEHRPENCRDYPYLEKPEFTFRTLGMISRLGECPAAYEVWEELKNQTGFRRRPPRRWGSEGESR